MSSKIVYCPWCVVALYALLNRYFYLFIIEDVSGERRLIKLSNDDVFVKFQIQS